MEATVKLRIIPKGIAEVRSQLNDINRNQVPFAMAKALTRTVQGGQGKVRESQKTRFTLRRAAWIRANVRITPATKKKLEAMVYDTFSAMELQEEGGVKVPMHAGRLAVPLSGARPTKRALIKPEDMPAEVMKNGGFIRNGVMYKVALKAGRRRKVSRAIGGISEPAQWSRKIVPMYFLAKSWKVDKRYGFRETVQVEVDKNFEANFRQAFNDAVKTAK